MATIWNNVTFDPCQRPAYTKYELSKMIKAKRNESGLGIDDFSIQYNVPTTIITSIEEAKRCFNASMYKACSTILGLDLDELLRFDQEDIGCVKFRTDEVNEETLHSVNLANLIFNEMVIQHKLSAK